MWLNFQSVTHFAKCEPFLFNCDPFFKLWSIIPIFSWCDPFIYPAFPCVIYASKCDFSSSVSQFYKLEPLLLVWPPFLRVSYFFKFKPFFKCLRLFQVWSTFFQVLPVAPGVTLSSKCDQGPLHGASIFHTNLWVNPVPYLFIFRSNSHGGFRGCFYNSQSWESCGPLLLRVYSADGKKLSSSSTIARLVQAVVVRAKVTSLASNAA